MNRVGVRRRIARAWPYLVVVIVPLALSVTHVARFTEMSPIDESRHLDYMIQLTDGHLVRLGDELGQDSMRIEACRGVELFDFAEPPCASRRFRPADFRDEGYSNVTGHPPGYYLLTGVPAAIAEGSGLAGSMLDPARLLGGVWIAIGLVLALRAGELLGIARVPMVAVSLAIVAAPGVLASASTVNPDAASVFAGGLVLLTAVRWERGRTRSWLPLAAVGAIVALLKMTNAVAVGIVVLWFAARAVALWRSATRDAERRDEHRSEAKRYVIGAAALLAGMSAATLLWIVVASARATIEPLDIPSNAQFFKESFPWGLTLERGNLFGLLPPLGDWFPSLLYRRGPMNLALVTGWLLIGVMLTSVLRVRAADRLSLIGAASFVVLLSGGVVLMMLTWAVNQVVFAPVARYSLSAVPFLILVTAGAVRGRVSPIVLSLYAALCCLVTFGVLVS